MTWRFAGREDSCTEFEVRNESDWDLGLSREVEGLWETLGWRWRSCLLLMVVTPDTLVYTFDHSRSRGKDRQTIGITARVLRRA